MSAAGIAATPSFIERRALALLAGQAGRLAPPLDPRQRHLYGRAERPG